MIHEIVKEALACMESYHIPRETDKFEMMYCTGRIEASSNKAEAMTALNQHLDKHYALANKTPAMCYVAKNES